MLTAIEPLVIQVRDVAGEFSRVPFKGERMIVGRGADAEIRLDHGMVSRQHVELTRDPSGRLHVRDLGSRNGTLVNGQPVTERSLQSGDQVGVGPFQLTIVSPEPSLTMSTRIILADGAGGRISTLKDMAAPRVDAAHLTTLTDFNQQLLDTPEPAARAAALCKLMVGSQFKGRWAVVVRSSMTIPDKPPQLLYEAHGALSNREPYLSRSVLRTVRETGEAVLAANVGLPADAEVNIEVSISPNVMAMAAVACPVAKGGDAIDLLYVMLPPSYGSGEWLALVTLAVRQYQQAESAWAARKQAESIAVMEKELSRAREIQMRLLPKDPQFEGLDVAIGFTPCRWVGGDYVDAVAMGDGRTLLAIADVCGKGLPAALIASSLHTMIHAGVLGGLGLRQMMSNLNQYLCAHLTDETFVTMLAVVVDSTSGDLEIVSAGHPPPLLIGCGADTPDMPSGLNLPLGLDRAELVVSQRRLEPGQMLALYTDGLSELSDEDSRMLGVEGLREELNRICSAANITSHLAAEELTRRLDSLRGQNAAVDDRTFLLARRRIGVGGG